MDSRQSRGLASEEVATILRAQLADRKVNAIALFLQSRKTPFVIITAITEVKKRCWKWFISIQMLDWV